MAKKVYTPPELVESENTHSGNTGLPFGLCKKYGIDLPNGATPRQAWEAQPLRDKHGNRLVY